MKAGCGTGPKLSPAPANSHSHAQELIMLQDTTLAHAIIQRPASPKLVSSAADPKLDPSTQGFVDMLDGSTPIYMLSPDAARAVLSGVQKSVKVSLPEVSR